jgi:hypothetical protein
MNTPADEINLHLSYLSLKKEEIRSEYKVAKIKTDHCFLLFTMELSKNAILFDLLIKEFVTISEFSEITNEEAYEELLTKSRFYSDCSLVDAVKILEIDKQNPFAMTSSYGRQMIASQIVIQLNEMLQKLAQFLKFKTENFKAGKLIGHTDLFLSDILLACRHNTQHYIKWNELKHYPRVPFYSSDLTGMEKEIHRQTKSMDILAKYLNRNDLITVNVADKVLLMLLNGKDYKYLEKQVFAAARQICKMANDNTFNRIKEKHKHKIQDLKTNGLIRSVNELKE